MKLFIILFFNFYLLYKIISFNRKFMLGNFGISKIIAKETNYHPNGTGSYI